jgi:peptide/nickel transport system permease protein
VTISPADGIDVSLLPRSFLARWRGQSRRTRPPLLSLLILAVFVVGGLIGPALMPYKPAEIDLSATLQPPIFAGGTAAHLLGTDQLGRDLLTRLVYGARISLAVGVAVVVLAGAIGVLLAMLSAYIGGRFDSVVSRTTDAMLAFPFLLFAIVVVAVFGPSVQVVIVVLTLSNWPQYARILRIEAIRIQRSDFVSMARVMGAPGHFVMWRHLLPNIAATFLVLASLQLGLAILAEGSLSFLGLGIPPPQPSWGSILADGRGHLADAWWLSIAPGLALSLTVLSANILGDWLRVRSDPTMRG